MDAGRELDALVAERVMGWKLFQSEPGYGRPPKHWSKPSLILAVIPHYSTDIAAAWEVVERLHASIPLDRMAHYSYLALTMTGHTTGWSASFDFNFDVEWHETADHLPFGARGMTPMEAICKAALKVMEYQPIDVTIPPYEG